MRELQECIKRADLEALIIDNPLDLYYLLGIDLSLGRLVVTPKSATLYVDGRYIEACRDLKECCTVQSQGFDETSVFFTHAQLKEKKVGFDPVYTSYFSYQLLNKLGAELIPIESLVMELRKQKSPVEIEKLQQAADLCAKGYLHILGLLDEGITEKEVSRELTLFWLKNGGEGPGFSTIIAFGENAALPHHRPTDRKLKKGECVLIDCGVTKNHYQSDMTRVHFFGDVDSEIKEIYKIVQEAHLKAKKVALPGVQLREVDAAARQCIEKAGYGKSFSHGLGHGIGLEVHEPPRLSFYGKQSEGELKEGMVVTIEPGIYLPGKGGVRLEDTYVIQNDGPFSITNLPFDPQLSCNKNHK